MSSSTTELEAFLFLLKISILFFGSVMCFVKNLSYSLLNLKFCSLQKVKSFWDLLMYENGYSYVNRFTSQSKK